MALPKMRSIPLWSICIGLSMVMGLAWWAFLAYNNVEPIREPAMEVSEYRVTKVPPEKIKTHIVEKGENLTAIASQYNLDVDTLIGSNENLSEVILPGDRLVILPKKGVLFTVTSGDTLWRIAKLFDVEVKHILEENNKEGAVLQIGEKLFIPGGKPLKAAAASLPVSRSAEARFLTPAIGEVSSPFGRRWGRMHAGLDIANDEGTPIKAALAGKVTYAGWMSGYGNTVMIEHRQGYSTLYGHMKRVHVGNGQSVNRGDIIGEMGSTGNSTGSHVHFEVRYNGELINPTSILR